MQDPTVTGEFTNDSVVLARADLLSTDLTETESVMLDIESGSYFGVESVARTIWDALAEPMSVAGLCAVVSSKYDVGDAPVEGDTMEFVSQLVEAGLVTIQG